MGLLVHHLQKRLEDDSQVEQFYSSEMCMVWLLAGWPLTSSICRLHFLKTTTAYDTQHVYLTFFMNLSEAFFGVEPVLFNHWIILATTLQLSFQVFTFLFSSCPSICWATMFLFSDLQWLICHEIPDWSSSDHYGCDNTTFNTTAAELVTPSHMTHQEMCTFAQFSFKGVFTFSCQWLRREWWCLEFFWGPFKL